MTDVSFLVSVCRALGIPCRSVTNFVSAHDTNSSLTVDKFFNDAGDEIEGQASVVLLAELILICIIDCTASNVA